MSQNQKIVMDIVFSVLGYLLITGFAIQFYKDLSQWEILISHTVVFSLGLFMKTRGELLIRNKLDEIYPKEK